MVATTKPAQAKSGDAKKSGFTKEEELLLQNFSRSDTTKSTALFYGNALIVSAIPFCKYISSDVDQRERRVAGE